MQFSKRVAFVTLGCKVNQYETENIKQKFLENGYKEVEFSDKADVYIVNSCTVTSIADRKTRNMLRRAKKTNIESVVVATGCYAQSNGQELLDIEEVDIVIGNTEKKDVYEKVQQYMTKKEKQIFVHDIFNEKKYIEHDFSVYREMSRAYVKIQDGCDNFCSYCKIPFARGNKRSRDIEEIKKEVRILADEGFKEIILIGINIGAYGEELEKKVTLEDVLRECSNIEGIRRIRIGSIYPDRINERFISTLIEVKKVMPHLHISLQSADNDILRLMKRKYSREEAFEKIANIKKAIPEISLTADVIVGFPFEKDENFLNTFNFVKEIGFSDIHIFQYSDREKTLASTYKEKVEPAIKKERADRLEELRYELFNEFRHNSIGKTYEILIEERESSTGIGYTDNYLKTKILNLKHDVNSIVRVKITGMEGELLLGE